VLGQLIEHLEYGPRRGDAFLYSAVAQCLASDAASVAASPSAYFHFDSGAAPGDQHPLEVPALPLAAPHSGTSARGWAAAWSRFRSLPRAAP